MPKAKPDRVVSHRIELQETEREVLKTYLTVNAATNGVRAVGALLTPFTGLLGAAAAAYLALYTAEEIADAMKSAADRAVTDTQAYYARYVVDKYQEFSALMQTKTWDDFSPEKFQTKGKDMVKEVQDFGREMAQTSDSAVHLGRQISTFITNFLGQTQQIDSAQEQGWTPSEAWANYYPIEEAINDAVSQRGGITNTIDGILRFTTVQGWAEILGLK